MRLLATEKRKRQRRQAYINSLVERIQPLYEQPTFEDIAQWLIDNQDLLLEYRTAKGIGFRSDEKGSKITSFKFIHMQYDNCCSNSHSAPKGMQTNWGGRRSPAVPRGYPGWRGRVEFTDERRGWHFSEVIRHLGICTGTGGGGSYDVTLWAQDFRKMAEPYVLDKLAGDIS